MNNGIEHEMTLEHGGAGFDGWIIPVCKCGWKGGKHYAHNDYQHSNAKEQWDRHFVDSVVQRSIARRSKRREVVA